VVQGGREDAGQEDDRDRGRLGYWQGCCGDVRHGGCRCESTLVINPNHLPHDRLIGRDRVPPEEQRDAEAAKSLVTASGGQCLLFPQDIRDEAGCKRVIDSVVRAWGRIDVLVNNASVMVSPPMAPSQQES